MQKASQLKPSLCKIAIQKYPPFDEPLRPFCCPYCPPPLPPLSLPLISLRRHAKIENRKLAIRNWVYFFSRRSCLLANHPIQIFHHHSKNATQQIQSKAEKIPKLGPNSTSSRVYRLLSKPKPCADSKAAMTPQPTPQRFGLGWQGG